MNDVAIAELRRSFRLAVKDCSERGLYNSSKWAAESLNGLRKIDSEVPPAAAAFESQPTDAEHDSYVLGKAYFDCREYDHASAVLSECISQKAVFLRVYAKYMAGEKRREEESEVVMGPDDNNTTVNRECVTLQSDLEEYMGDNCLEPFILYL